MGGNKNIPTMKIEKVLKISEDGKSVLGVYDKEISTVVIPDGIEVIGEGAFEDCTLLKEVVISETVKLIEREAFQGCKCLQSIKLPSQLKVIENSVFSKCELLESIEIPSCVERIDDFAFLGCSLLKKIELPKSLKAIGERAFSYCNSLTSIRIPGSVKNLDRDGVIWYCEKLKKIEMEEGIESLGDTFPGCTAVKTITIPNSLRNLDGLVFSDFKSLRNIVLAKDNPYFVLENNVLYSKDKKRIIRALPCIGPHFVVPKSVRMIDRLAFTLCKHLEEITIHDHVRSIGNGAFSGCKKLKGIVLPKSLRKIEQHTFLECSVLSEVVLQSGLREIEWNAFFGCKSLHHLHLPESVKTIQTGFASSLKEYTVSPDNKYFAAIDGVLYNKNLTKLIEMPRECNVKTFTVPDSVTVIGYSAFWYCKGLKRVILPKGLKVIEGDAFGNCSSLKSILLPSGIKNIPKGAFRNCKSLAYVELPDKLRAIEEGAFWGCDLLQFVFPPLGLRLVENMAFPDNLIEIYTRCCNPTQIDAYVISDICQNNEWEVYIEVPQGTLSKYEKLKFFGNCKLFEMKIPLSELEEPCIKSFDDNGSIIVPEDYSSSEISDW